MPTLTDQLAATRQGAAGHLPPPVAATFTGQQEVLAASAAPRVAPGTTVPDAALVSATGDETTLAAVVGGRPAVLVFYRGGWCPYCNLALRSYQADLLPELQARGVALVAVSPQRPDGSLSTKEAGELAFDVVSDPGNALAGALGIVDDGSDEVRAAQAQLGLDLAQVNEGGDVRLPMPAVVFVDADRTVRWAEVHPDYTTRTEPAAVLAAVEAG